MLNLNHQYFLKPLFKKLAKFFVKIILTLRCFFGSYWAKKYKNAFFFYQKSCIFKAHLFIFFFKKKRAETKELTTKSSNLIRKPIYILKNLIS